MILSIVTAALVLVVAYIAYKTFKSNKDMAGQFSYGFKKEAKVLKNKIVEEIKEVVEKTQIKLRNPKKNKNN